MTFRAPENAPRQFLVIDDHPLFCQALSMTLRAIQADSHVTAANSLGDGMQALADGATPDAVLLDLNLPDVDGLDGLQRLRKKIPDTPVVVISSLDTNGVITRVLNAGAVGFISKSSGGGELEAAFRKIWAGETYTPPTYRPVPVTASEADDGADSLAQMETLTSQQKRILHLVAEGKLNKQIAADLSIAETTVKAHLTVILRKLKVHSRTQAALIAQKAELSSDFREARQDI